jgi:hypothetical protein
MLYDWAYAHPEVYPGTVGPEGTRRDDVSLLRQQAGPELSLFGLWHFICLICSFRGITRCKACEAKAQAAKA